jgi:membrane fusion protein (multidrug efflux system)
LSGINFEEGQSVKKGHRLVTLEDGEHQAQLAAVSAELRTAKQKFLRSKELYEQKFISKEALDLQAGSVERLAALVDDASARLMKTVVTAPFSGILGLRKVSPGAYLRAGDDIAVLENVDSVKVDFRVPEVYLAKVRVGQVINVAVDAFPGTNFVGKVYATESGIDQETRTALLRGRIKNESGKLRPGMFARVSLVMSKKENALSIPEQALWPQGTDNFVYKVVDGRVSLAKVVLGQRTPGYVEIVEGVSPGDVVVTEGQIKIRDGAPVTVIGGSQ